MKLRLLFLASLLALSTSAQSPIAQPSIKVVTTIPNFSLRTLAQVNFKYALIFATWGLTETQAYFQGRSDALNELADLAGEP